MKQIISIILAFVFLVGCTTQSSDYTTSDVVVDKTYEDSTNGFRIVYPSNWYQDDIQRANVILDLKSPGRVATVTVKKYENTDQTTQEESNEWELSNEFKEQIEQTGQISSFEAKSSTINGVPVVKATYIETDDVQGVSYSFKMLSVHVVKDENVFFGVNYVVLPENYNDYLTDAEKIINSFEITNR